MGLFERRGSSSAGICPVCATPSSRGGQIANDIDRSIAHGVASASQGFVRSAPNRDSFFCQAAFALQQMQQRNPTKSIAEYLANTWPQDVSRASAMAHPEWVRLDTSCFVCKSSSKPAMFSEIRKIKDSGGELLFGDASAHYKMTDICWVVESNYGHEDELIPVHRNCAARLNPFGWHMGRPI